VTCIVGISDGRTVWLGGDSAGVAGYSLVVRADQKVFSAGDFCMGFTDSFRMGQLLRYSLRPPACDESTDLFAYMCGPFIEAVRGCLKVGGYARMRDEAEEGGNFLVGFRGRLFEVCSDYQVGETVSGFNAVGCGAAVALGALEAYSTLPAATRPACEDQARLALRAAETWNIGVRGPFHVVSSGEATPKPTPLPIKDAKGWRD
jgi:hypothetical protein